MVIQVDDGDSIETYWYCEDTGMEVMSVYESADGDGTYVLMSYSFTPEDSGNENMMLYLAVGIVVVVAVVASVLLFRRRRGGPGITTAPEETTPESSIEGVLSPE